MSAIKDELADMLKAYRSTHTLNAPKRFLIDPATELQIIDYCLTDGLLKWEDQEDFRALFPKIMGVPAVYDAQEFKLE